MPQDATLTPPGLGLLPIPLSAVIFADKSAYVEYLEAAAGAAASPATPAFLGASFLGKPGTGPTGAWRDFVPLREKLWLKIRRKPAPGDAAGATPWTATIEI